MFHLLPLYFVIVMIINMIINMKIIRIINMKIHNMKCIEYISIIHSYCVSIFIIIIMNIWLSKYIEIINNISCIIFCICIIFKENKKNKYKENTKKIIQRKQYVSIKIIRLD